MRISKERMMLMKKYYDTKIGKIIEEEFDARMESAVFSYIMDKGIEFIKQLTEEDIETIEGNGIMSKDFMQSLVRCAKRIGTECEWIEIIEYIRLYLLCTPSIKEISLSRREFTKESFAELLNNLQLNDEDVRNEISLFVVVDKDCLKEC